MLVPSQIQIRRGTHYNSLIQTKDENEGLCGIRAGLFIKLFINLLLQKIRCLRYIRFLLLRIREILNFEDDFQRQQRMSLE